MYFVLMALLLSFTFNACSSDSPEEVLPEKEEPEVPPEKYEDDVVNPDYVPIDWEKTKLHEIDEENGRYSFDASSETENLKPGSILTIDADTASYIVIVKKLKRDNGKISIEARKGDLCDIFANTEFTLSTGGESARNSSKNVMLPQKISFLDIDGEWKEYDFMNSSSPSHLTGNLWKWNNDELEGRVLYDHPKFKIYLEKSDFHIDIDLNMTLSFSGRTLQEVKDDIEKQYRSKALSIAANIEGRFETNQQLRLDAWHQYTCDNDERIKELSKYLPKIRVVFSVFGVPVEVSLNADVYRAVSFSLDGEISAYMGFTDKASGTLGFKWNQSDDRLGPVKDFKNELSVTYPTMKGKGDMNGKVWLYPRIRVILYELLGPSFDIRPYMRTNIHGGFYEELLSSSKDFCAWDLSNYVGLDARAGLSLMFVGHEVKNISTGDMNVFDKCIYHSPYDIRYVSSTSKSVQRNVPNTVKFEVYDMDSILNKSIPTILRQIVKFEGKGELSSKYGIVDHGQVSVEWIPTSFKDTLYARLYNVDGKIMKEAKFYGDTQINVMTENASVEKTDVICFGKLEGMDDFSEVEYGIKINENHVTSHNINNSIYSVELSDLSEGKYNYCAYAKIGTEIYYGDIKTFTIEKNQYLSLEEFYNSTNGDNWINNKGWLKEADLLDWYGIENEQGSVRLSLEANNLSGDAILRNCDYVTSLFLGDNPISSLTLENCYWKVRLPQNGDNPISSSYGRLQVGLPGNGENINMVSCKGGTYLYAKNGKIGNLDVSFLRGGLTIQRDISGQDERNVEIGYINYSNSYDPEWSHNIIHGVNTIVNEINISDCPGISVYIPKIKKIKIKNISRPLSNAISGIDVGVYDYRGDGHIGTVHVDQCGKPLGGLSFRHRVDILDITNVDGFSEQYDYSLFLTFDKGVKEVNVSNVSVKHFGVWTPNVTPINISNSKMYISAGYIYNGVDTADNVYHIKDCIIIYDAWNMEESMHISSFTGTERQLSDYIWSLEE